MFQVFTTREVSMAIWTLLLLLIIFISKEIRKFAIDVIKIAFSKQLLIPILPMLLYSFLLTYLFSLTVIWKCYYIKDIILWIMFVGIPLFYGSIQKNTLDDYFKDMFLSNLKFIVLVEFFLSLFSFNLIIELILVPVVSSLVLLDAVAGLKAEYKMVKRFTSRILVIAGLLIFYQSITIALKDYNTLSIEDTLVSFFIPIVFTILFIPISYLFALYAKYQIVFIRMGFKEKNNKRIKWWHRGLIIKSCHFSHRKLLYLEQNYIKNMYIDMSDDEFRRIIDLLDYDTKEITKVNKKVYSILGLVLFFAMPVTIFINQLLALICGLVMIIFYSISMLQDSKNSIIKCCGFLLKTSIMSLLILALLIYIFPSISMRVEKMKDLGVLIYIVVYTIIQLVFFIIVTFRAEHDVARISILILATIVTLIYTLGSAIVNAVPLSSLNSLLIQNLHMNTYDVIYFNKNYDGRILINVLIQIITYPIWCNTMIATVVGEIKQYKTNRKYKEK